MSGWTEIDATEIFARAFTIRPEVLIPAILIVVLSLFKLRVQLMMSASILASAVIAIFIQGAEIGELLKISMFGFYPDDEELAKILSGGGIISMTNVIAIVCLSSCYAGIFGATGFLNSLQKILLETGKKFFPFAGIFIAAIVTSMISCNQTLAIMLTHQLCQNVEPRADILAIHLENSAVVISPLIPWSIAGTVVLTPLDAPTFALLAAWYLYLIPLCSLARRK